MREYDIWIWCVARVVCVHYILSLRMRYVLYIVHDILDLDTCMYNMNTIF